MAKLRTTLYAALTALAIGAVAAPSVVAAPPPSLNAPDLAQGPFSRMHMLLEKTFLKVDVATIDIRYGAKTQSKFAKAAQGKTLNPALEEQLAKLAVAADDAVVQMRFERNVSLSQWSDQVEASLGKAVKAGYITAARRDHVVKNLSKWFAPIGKRGYKEGDKLLYRVTPTGLRTVVVTVEGQKVVDLSQPGDAARVVFAGYFAPDTDMRKPLLKSLFK